MILLKIFFCAFNLSFFSFIYSYYSFIWSFFLIPDFWIFELFYSFPPTICIFLYFFKNFIFKDFCYFHKGYFKVFSCVLAMLQYSVSAMAMFLGSREDILSQLLFIVFLCLCLVVWVQEDSNLSVDIWSCFCWMAFCSLISVALSCSCKNVVAVCCFLEHFSGILMVCPLGFQIKYIFSIRD